VDVPAIVGVPANNINSFPQLFLVCNDDGPMIYNGKRSGYTAKDISKLSFRPQKSSGPTGMRKQKKEVKMVFCFTIKM
jgi:hypothetical protein